MNRGEHKWRVKADDKFKQYFKRWEVLKSCQSKIKDYFEKRRNVIARQRNVNSEQSAHNEGSSEENPQHRLLLPLLKSEGKCGSLDDLEAKKPIFEFGRSKKRIADESWKKRIKKYKIDGFLCVPSLFKYDPIDLLRTSSDTCVRYGNYEPLVAPERRFWGVLKRNPTFPDKGGGTGVDARKVRMDPNKEPDLKSSLNVGAQKSFGVEKEQQSCFGSSKTDRNTHQISRQDVDRGSCCKASFPAPKSSSSSIDGSLMKRFTKPLCQQQKQSSTKAKVEEDIETHKHFQSAASSNFHITRQNAIQKGTRRGLMTGRGISEANDTHQQISTNGRFIIHKQNVSGNTSYSEASAISQKIKFLRGCSDGAASFGGDASPGETNVSETTTGVLLSRKVSTKSENGKFNIRNPSVSNNDEHGIVSGDRRLSEASQKMIQNAKCLQLKSSYEVHNGCRRVVEGKTTDYSKIGSTSQEKCLKTGENTTNTMKYSQETGSQHVSSMCVERKPNLAGLVFDASKLSRSIKTSTSNGVPSTQKRDFQYQCRRKRSENTEKTALRVMNYCFEGHVTMPVALKSDNRRLLSIDKVCSGRDGVKKKDRQYGSNFSVKASKSHFDLTTQVLLQARSPRK